jgi:osmotically inducible protein OsmC
MEKLYTATATASGGRNGHVETSDGLLKFDLSLPKSMGGSERANATNPEQLFACGYAACFGGALDLAARQKNITLKEVSITAEVTIGREEGGFMLAVELKARLPDLDPDQAEQLMTAAHQLCPYSKATRGNIEVRLTVL